MIPKIRFNPGEVARHQIAGGLEITHDRSLSIPALQSVTGPERRIFPSWPGPPVLSVQADRPALAGIYDYLRQSDMTVSLVVLDLPN